MSLIPGIASKSNQFCCNEFFDPGLLTTIMDVGAGSSGKGKLGSYVAEHADNVQFAINTFHPQAGHWVRLDDGREFFYQSLNSCAYLLGDSNDHHDNPGRPTSLEKLYIAPGAMIELPALLREIKENGILPHQLGISPLVPILDPAVDGGFEQGRYGFDGAGLPPGTSHEGTAKFGSTAHGVGSCNARRVLRRPSLRLARDVPELAPYLCDVTAEVLGRLQSLQSGILELAQGYQLSLMHPLFFPYTTSRNVTVSQGLSDCMLPPRYAGQTLGNIRTYPIRINSRKFIAEDGRHLTWAQVQAGVPHTVYEGNSGGWYPDQTELTWEELTAKCGSSTPITEITSVTKLPRRVATFSRQNVIDWVEHNDTGHRLSLSVNFANYTCASLLNARDPAVLAASAKWIEWMAENLAELPIEFRFIGTGAKTDDMIFLPD